jgi:hypothetical protein
VAPARPPRPSLVARLSFWQKFAYAYNRESLTQSPRRAKNRTKRFYSRATQLLQPSDSVLPVLPHHYHIPPRNPPLSPEQQSYACTKKPGSIQVFLPVKVVILSLLYQYTQPYFVKVAIIFWHNKLDPTSRVVGRFGRWFFPTRQATKVAAARDWRHVGRVGRHGCREHR